MCGISGIVNVNKQKFTGADLKAFTDSINHRGPDDVGYMVLNRHDKIQLFGDQATPISVYSSSVPYRPTADISTYSDDSFEIAFGHRRLSILDLSPFGHIPMSYNNGRYWITYNGEVYNYKLIKEELIALGHHFISQTDTEVILAAYAEWGIACQEKFNGMWAFCIYDVVKQEIFMSRDRFGIKPMYYWNSPGSSFCFGSEIKQFTFLPGWKAVLNKQKGFDYLVYNMTDHSDETMFKGVFHLPPGHYFKSTVNDLQADADGKIIPVKWYQPVYKGYSGSFEEAAKSFESHFKNSVKDHLISDVPVGSALSGGLDSSAIVCEINNLLRQQGKEGSQKTFSYCASEEKFNEKKWIDEVVKATAVNAHYVSLTGEEVFKKTEELIWFNDEPAQSQSLLASFQVYSAAKDNNVKALINGQGADEYLSGYGAFTTFRWVQLLKKWKFKKLNYEITNTPGNSKKNLLSTYFQLCYHFVPDRIKRYFSRNTQVYQEVLSLISLEQLQAKELHPYDSIPYKSNSVFEIAHKQMLFDPLQKYLRYEDRMSMANSIEARVPFLDYRLVEFSTQLPANYLDSMGELKKIMRHGLKNILPKAILERKDKIGFITSEENWVKVDYTNEFRAMLEQSIGFSKGIIKTEALTYFDNVAKGIVPFSYNYWRFIQFGLWMKKFKVELN